MTPTVAEIEAMDRAALMAAWSDLFRSPVPKGLSQSFLRRFLAFEVQARQLGGLPKRFLANLDGQNAAKAARSDATLKPGGRLLREWNGTTHTVEVIDEGFHWVLSDGFEPVSARPVKLALISRQVDATRREQQHGLA